MKQHGSDAQTIWQKTNYNKSENRDIYTWVIYTHKKETLCVKRLNAPNSERKKIKKDKTEILRCNILIEDSIWKLILFSTWL